MQSPQMSVLSPLLRSQTGVCSYLHTSEWCWLLSGLLAHCQPFGTTFDGFWPGVCLKCGAHKVHTLCCKRGPSVKGLRLAWF